MKYFVTQRRESVRRQLDGESAGAVLDDWQPDWKQIVPWLVAISMVVLLNLSGWLWGVVAGFRGSAMWGFLNLLFYPLAPIIYGFAIQKTLGRRSAIWSLFCITCIVALIITGIALNSK